MLNYFQFRLMLNWFSRPGGEESLLSQSRISDTPLLRGKQLKIVRWKKLPKAQKSLTLNLFRSLCPQSLEGNDISFRFAETNSTGFSLEN